MDSPAKAEKVQRKKDERPRRKPRSVECRAFPPVATRVIITSSLSIALCSAAFPLLPD
jgi:hypothetical protein